MATLIQNGTVVNADGQHKSDVLCDGETILQVAPNIPAAGHTVVDATGLLVMPGGVDVHTHLDMPFGGTVSADDYRTGTIAAAVGGTTTVIDFALQSRGHTMGEALETWLAKSDGKACIDYGLHMAVTDLGPGDGAQGLAEMETMVQKGISSFKLFMAYPSVLMIDDGLMYKVMHKAGLLNALCCIHAENGSVIDIVVARMLAEGKTEPHHHAHSRSTHAEAEATHRAIAIAHMAGAAVYIVHLSNEDSLRELKHAQQRGLHALAETCPQYLVLSLEEQMPGKSWEEAKYVFTPPLRKSTTSPRCGRRSRTARCPSSPPTTAPSALPTRSRWAKTTSPRFPTEARASRTVCRSSGTLEWSWASSRRRSLSSSVAPRPPASSACRKRASSLRARTRISCSGIPTPTTPSPPPPSAWPPTTPCSKAGRCQATPGTSSPAVSW